MGLTISRSTQQATYRKGESMLQFFAKRLKELQEVERDERGFTLIELLVVIIIIGILAAIAIPTFLAQRERAWEGAAASDLRNAAAAATSCSSRNDGDYTACPPANLQAFGYNPSENVTVAPVANTTTRWSASSVNTLDDGTTYRFDTNVPGGPTAANPQGRVYCDPATNPGTGGADC
jgi:type IV pilus assembly protein PilA